MSARGDVAPRPAPIPAPDRTQIESLNTLYELDERSRPTAGLRARLIARARRMVARLLFRQQQFNAAVVDHLNRNALVGLEAHQASVRMLDWMEESLASYEMGADDLRRYREALLARERRSEIAITSLISAHEELRSAVGVLQHATQSLKQQVQQLALVAPEAASSARRSTSADRASVGVEPNAPTAFENHNYVGFEDQFRGTQHEIRERLAEYLPLFEGASDVLDIGCGRGEFLALLRQHGISAHGIDINRAMVDMCRETGLDATKADALAYMRSLPDGSVGGLLAAQVVEHLEPAYLTALLDAAFAKLRPGAVIVLETINPACWFAFFESYIRDITHVRPLHPDTLKYLLIASGFQRVDLRYRAPYPEHDKLQPIAGGPPSLEDWAETLNANVEKINRLLFTWLDYAAIGRRP